MVSFLSIVIGTSMRSMSQSSQKGLPEKNLEETIKIKITHEGTHAPNVFVQHETSQVFPDGGSALEQPDGHTSTETGQSPKRTFEGGERVSMGLMPDATKAFEAEGVIIVRARDGANGRAIIFKGQAERAGAQKLRGNLKREDG